MLTVFTFGDSILDCGNYNGEAAEPGRLRSRARDRAGVGAVNRVERVRRRSRQPGDQRKPERYPDQCQPPAARAKRS